MAESKLIYKICSKAVWEEIRLLKSWTGSPHDVQDGFIHFSAASQLEGTFRKYYAGQTDLMLLAIDADAQCPEVGVLAGWRLVSAFVRPAADLENRVSSKSGNVRGRRDRRSWVRLNTVA